MADEQPKSFTHTLVGDCDIAFKRLKSEDSQTNRRALIRAIFAAIEGLVWRLKQDIYSHSNRLSALTAHEQAAMLEEGYNVDKNGIVSAIPRFLPLPSKIRLVVRIVQRYRPDYTLDFNHQGWANLKSSVDVRNRIIHPKSLTDLEISDDEISEALSAFNWMLALNIEALRETASHLEGLNETKAAELRK